MRTRTVRALTRSGLLMAVSASCLTFIGCDDKSAGESRRSRTTPNFPVLTPTEQQSAAGAPSRDLPSPITITTSPEFKEVQEELGISFVYDNGAAPERRIVESTGGGAGWLDLDADDFPDLYLVQGGSPLSADVSKNSSDRAFRNRAGLKFDDVTVVTGIDERRYGQGVAVGDFDGDGFDDIYITNVGPDTLYHGQGDGTYLDVSDALGQNGTGWGSSAAWADLDGDGDLDLFVCQYLTYDPDHPTVCVDPNGNPRICHPSEVSPQANICLRNEGNGEFTDVLDVWGLQGEGSKSLGLVIADLNGDHRPDIYVGNDTTANHLFVQREAGQFSETAQTAGVATDGLGKNQASMGVALGDYDNDGLPDLYATHFTQEYNTLYRNLGDGSFLDVTPATGMMRPTMSLLGFGTVMQDFNFDGHMDLLVANGHIDVSFVKAGDKFRMPAQLFSYNGKQWELLSRNAGDYFQKERIGRGIATADYDNDGDADVVIVNQNAEIALLQNSAQHGHWLKIRLAGTWGNRRGIGAEVQVIQGEHRCRQQLAAGTSFCASHQPALFFGLGPADTTCDVLIRWPNGKQQQLSGLKVDQEIILQESLAR